MAGARLALGQGLVVLQLRGHVHRDCRGLIELRVFHRAAQGDDAKQITRARFGGVVGPKEALDRMLGGGHGGARWQSLVPIFEALDPAHPIALHRLPRRIQLRAFDRIAQQIRSAGGLATQGVPCQHHHMGSRVGRGFELVADTSCSHGDSCGWDSELMRKIMARGRPPVSMSSRQSWTSALLTAALLTALPLEGSAQLSQQIQLPGSWGARGCSPLGSLARPSTGQLMNRGSGQSESEIGGVKQQQPTALPPADPS